MTQLTSTTVILITMELANINGLTITVMMSFTMLKNLTITGGPIKILTNT